MKYIFNVILLCMSYGINAQSSVHAFKFVTLAGQEKSFSDFSGKKILIVNTASECGFTKQYEGLQELHEKYGDKLVIIGFPANNFGGQEPGSTDEIAAFCKLNYGVTFLMADKVSVNGKDRIPLFNWLCQQENPSFKGDIKWNFEKFLLDENGQLVDRFRSAVKPNSNEITTYL